MADREYVSFNQSMENAIEEIKEMGGCVVNAKISRDIDKRVQI